jgi:hypothetical protein
MNPLGTISMTPTAVVKALLGLPPDFPESAATNNGSLTPYNMDRLGT